MMSHQIGRYVQGIYPSTHQRHPRNQIQVASVESSTMPWLCQTSNNSCKRHVWSSVCVCVAVGDTCLWRYFNMHILHIYIYIDRCKLNILYLLYYYIIIHVYACMYILYIYIPIVWAGNTFGLLEPCKFAAIARILATPA